MSFILHQIAAWSKTIDQATAHLARAERSAQIADASRTSRASKHPPPTKAPVSLDIRSSFQKFPSWKSALTLPTFGIPAWRVSFSLLAILCMYLSAKDFISSLEFRFNNGSPSISSCKVFRWFDLLTFFGANFFAHAATVKTLPGEDSQGINFSILMILFFPFAGINRGIESIMRRAHLPYWDRQALYDLWHYGKWPKVDDITLAARSGALCTFVRAKGWEPSDGMTVPDMELLVKSKNGGGDQSGDGFKLAAGGPVVHNHFNYVDDPRVVEGSSWTADLLEWSGYRIAVLPSNVLLESNPLKDNGEPVHIPWTTKMRKPSVVPDITTTAKDTPFKPTTRKRSDGVLKRPNFNVDIFSSVTANTPEAEKAEPFLEIAPDAPFSQTSGLSPQPPKEDTKLPILNLPEPEQTPSKPADPASTNQMLSDIRIPYSRNVPQIIIASLQLVYASALLFYTRSSHLELTMTPALALFILPYLIMTLINLLANLLTPTYTKMHLVSSMELHEALTFASWLEAYGFPASAQPARLVQDGPGCSETSMTGTFESLDPFRGEWTLADVSVNRPAALDAEEEAPLRRESLDARRYKPKAQPSLARYVAKQRPTESASLKKILRVPQCSPFRRTQAIERWHPRFLPVHLFIAVMTLCLGPFAFIHLYTPSMSFGFRAYWTALGCGGGAIMPLWPKVVRKLPRQREKTWTVGLILVLGIILGSAVAAGLLVGKYAGEEGACLILDWF